MAEVEEAKALDAAKKAQDQNLSKTMRAQWKTTVISHRRKEELFKGLAEASNEKD